MTQNKEMILQAYNFDIIFHVRASRFPNQIRVQITIKSKSNENQYEIKSIETSVEHTHMLMFCRYLRKHIEKLYIDPHTESHWYLDDDLLYTVQGLIGGQANEGDIRFTLIFLVNTGSERKRVFLGGQTSVLVSDTLLFIGQIEKYIQNRAMYI